MRRTVSVVLVGVVISACGGGGSAGSGEHTVASGNTAPLISGVPPSAVVYSNTYIFAPDAFDPDGDLLTFEVDNKPPWADFDPQTGLLSGTPGFGDTGVYANILISVSDGSVKVSLPAFSINVSQSALGAITLQWQPPTENADGSPLIDLAGYIIHFGRSSGAYQNEIRLDNPGLTTYVIENLAPGTYYIAATSFNSAGVEGEFSGEIVTTVN